MNIADAPSGSQDAALPRYFETPAAFRDWLDAHGLHATALIVGFCKRGSGLASITWPEAVDEALCVGWVDGVRKRIDDARYQIRFTPRKAQSTWSAVNIARVAVLEAEGRMRPAGLAAFARRTEARSVIYAYEQTAVATLAPHEEAALRANAAACTFFTAQPPGYRRRVLWHVVSAQQAVTRARRLSALIDASARNERL